MSSIIQPTHTDEMQVYIMPADQGEQERLDMQHRLIVKLFDSKLSILPISLKEGDRVLECGAGTGIWMLEFAAQLPPTVQIHGIDITSGLFPTSYPDNIRFTVHSVTSLPESWTSSYNFLHQRFLIGGLTKDMWKSATMEMFRVLVKGGWIELLETAVGGTNPIPRYSYSRFVAGGRFC
ncbi:hypothetical protein PILCRDRAFT_825559 [Piloderma croceum F 1598]|uniref:Methyltransferase domain-containing protein n=1 Tax=Piloderma croceum (strain F 1598) TaxID=765440 RepID=A0A0C3EXG9_PILCF|nr:hypothetical protein PILCRDRAFT_825559 [Piloderma croceum F 1598]